MDDESFTEAQKVLHKQLAERSDKDSLRQRNILKDDNIAPAICEKKRELEFQQTIGHVEQRLRTQPSVEQLMSANIMQDVDRGRVSVEYIEAKQRMDREIKYRDLTRSLRVRPDSSELQRRNILGDVSVAPILHEKQRSLVFQQRQVQVSHSLTNRPQTDDLLGANILHEPPDAQHPSEQADTQIKHVRQELESKLAPSAGASGSQPDVA